MYQSVMNMTVIQKQVPDDVIVLTDLSDGDQYQFPPSLVLSDLRPDLVAYSNLTKSVTMVELTVCYETNFKDAQSRKERKYMDCLLYTSPSPRDATLSRMPSSA